jgi:predicted transcriptional regulator
VEKTSREIYFTLRLTQQEAQHLTRLARETDRSRAAVMRRLLDLAAVLPEARRLLGDPGLLEVQK